MDYGLQKDWLLRFLGATRSADLALYCDLSFDGLEQLARQFFLATVRTLTPQEISRLSSRRKSSPTGVLDRWRRDDRIFSLSHDGRVYYPAFQFFEGHPRRPIAKILQLLGPQTTYWPIAFWFTSANDELLGARPADILVTNWKWMLTAARVDFVERPSSPR